MTILQYYIETLKKEFNDNCISDADFNYKETEEDFIQWIEDLNINVFTTESTGIATTKDIVNYALGKGKK